MADARGKSGAIKEGYRIVARLGAWTLAGLQVSATASDVNAFALEHHTRLDLVLDLGARQWIWRDVVVSGTGPVTVTLPGRPEVR